MIGGLVTVLVGHLVETAKLKAYAAALYAAAAASLLFAFVFALGSLRHWIAVRYGSEYPDLWIAAGFVVLAIPFVGFGIWMQSQKPKPHPAASIALLAGPPAARLAMRTSRAAHGRGRRRADSEPDCRARHIRTARHSS